MPVRMFEASRFFWFGNWPPTYTRISPEIKHNDYTELHTVI